MRRKDAVALIDEHKNRLVNPVDMLHWTWLRVILANLSDEDWERAMQKAAEVLAR